MKKAIAAAAGLLIGAAGAQAQTTIYSNNFSTQTGSGAISGTGNAAVTPSGENYFELANSHTATLSANTSAYSSLNLTFDLYAIQSTDGNGDGTNADNFYIYLNGATTPTYSINASNVNFESQDFNGNLSESGPGNIFGARTGATAIGNLGYGYNGFFGSQDATYHITFALPDAAITSISFVGATNEDATTYSNGTLSGNEAYGIDNIVLSGQGMGTNPVGAVPEPASWAMLITGFGLMGAGMRYRRKRQVLRYV